MNRSFRDWLASIPGIMDFRAIMRARQAGSVKFLWHAPPGHFYSALPSENDVRYALETAATDPVSELDMRPEAQLEWWRKLTLHFSRIPFRESQVDGLRYQFENPYYSHGDAEILFATLCELRPRSVIEIGSGFSSALMLDTDEYELGQKTRFTFIEPYPNRLNSLLKGSDHTRVEVIKNPVQLVPLELFQRLEAGDILFIDSSHVAKAGSDLLHLMFKVWPTLKSGVVVHIHDIFWPFEYPADWLTEGRSWNEAYFLRSFLAGNVQAEVLLMNSWLEANHPAELGAIKPVPKAGSGLWLKKR